MNWLRRLLIVVGVIVLFAVAFCVWFVYIPPLRPAGVDRTYSFAWMEVRSGVWIGCWPVAGRPNAATCQVVFQDGEFNPKIAYLTYPPGLAVPPGQLHVDGSATNPKLGVFYHLNQPDVAFEPVIILKGGVALLPANEYDAAVMEYIRHASRQ